MLILKFDVSINLLWGSQKGRMLWRREEIRLWFRIVKYKTRCRWHEGQSRAFLWEAQLKIALRAGLAELAGKVWVTFLWAVWIPRWPWPIVRSHSQLRLVSKVAATAADRFSSLSRKSAYKQYISQVAILSGLTKGFYGGKYAHGFRKTIFKNSSLFSWVKIPWTSWVT